MIVTVTLQVDFISQYPGEHRVCWRIQGSGDDYDCSNIITCLGNGNTCTVSISVEVESDFCGPYTIEGYVQAICNTEGSLDGRVEFEAEYNNTPTCQGYTIECTSVSLNKILIIDYGSGFDPTDPAPVVTVSGNATAVAVIADTNTAIREASINTPGSGYFSGGSGRALAVAAVTAGPGLSATFDVDVVDGEIIKIELVAQGSAWTLASTFTFANTNLGGTGSGFLGDVDTLTTIGELKAVNLTFVGTGYTGVPVVTVNPTGFSDVPVVLARLADCPVLTQAMIGPNCDGSARATTKTIPLNGTLHICNSAAPPGGYPTGYVATQDGCCYDCTEYTVEALAGSGTPDGWADVYYIDCTTLDLTYEEIGGAAPGETTFCAVTGSVLVITKEDIVTLTDNGDCP